MSTLFSRKSHNPHTGHERVAIRMPLEAQQYSACLRYRGAAASRKLNWLGGSGEAFVLPRMKEAGLRWFDRRSLMSHRLTTSAFCSPYHDFSAEGSRVVPVSRRVVVDRLSTIVAGQARFSVVDVALVNRLPLASPLCVPVRSRRAIGSVLGFDGRLLHRDCPNYSIRRETDRRIECGMRSASRS